MKKNMKGFTLIELLAVIVILAVIALIATPIIMNVINEAKVGADRDGAYGVLKSIETSIAQRMVKEPEFNMTDKTCTITVAGSKITCATSDVTPIVVEFDIKGTKPESGTVVFDENGKIATGTKIKMPTATEFTYNGDKITN